MRLSLDLWAAPSINANGQGDTGVPSFDLAFGEGQFDERIFLSRLTLAWLFDGTEFAADAPRLDGEKGFLVEDRRVRINTAPRDLTGPPWTHGTGITSVTRDAVGFDGTANTATTVSINDPTTEGWLYETLTVTENTDYVFSFYALQGTATAPYYAVYDATNAAFLFQDVEYQPGVGEFVRISIPFTTPAGCTSVHVYPLRNAGGDGTVTVILDMVQLEEGAFASTPIVAASSQLRNADVANLPFDFEPNQGMLVVAFEHPTGVTSGLCTIASMHDGTTDNEIRVVFNATTSEVYATMTTGGVLQGTVPYIGTAPIGVPHKVSIAYNADQGILFGSLDGGDDEALMGSIDFPTAHFVAVELGESPSGNINDQALNGYLARVAYYKFAPSGIEGTKPYTL